MMMMMMIRMTTAIIAIENVKLSNHLAADQPYPPHNPIVGFQHLSTNGRIFFDLISLCKYFRGVQSHFPTLTTRVLEIFFSVFFAESEKRKAIVVRSRELHQRYSRERSGGGYTRCDISNIYKHVQRCSTYSSSSGSST